VFLKKEEKGLLKERTVKGLENVMDNGEGDVPKRHQAE
jgi:hypothetical protein